MMQPQVQPRGQTPRKRYVAPILEQYGKVQTLTETAPFIGSFNSDAGTYPLSYGSAFP